MEKYFYQQNRAKLLDKLDDDGVVILFGSSAPYKNAKGYYGRTLDMNFFYLTGLNSSSSIVAMWGKNGSQYERLFIEKPDPDEEKWSGVKMKSSEATEIAGVEDVVYLSEFDVFLSDMLASPEIGIGRSSSIRSPFDHRRLRRR